MQTTMVGGMTGGEKNWELGRKKLNGGEDKRRKITFKKTGMKALKSKDASFWGINSKNFPRYARHKLIRRGKKVNFKEEGGKWSVIDGQIIGILHVRHLRAHAVLSNHHMK